MNVNANVLKRFVIYMAILTFVMFTVWGFIRSFSNRPAGDYETEVCDIRLKDKLYEKALDAANKRIDQMNKVLDNQKYQLDRNQKLRQKEVKEAVIDLTSQFPIGDTWVR